MLKAETWCRMYRNKQGIGRNVYKCLLKLIIRYFVLGNAYLYKSIDNSE